VDCYVTTNAYPFDNTSTNVSVVMNDYGPGFCSGASGPGSDKNGRVNTAAYPPLGTSAIQICKDLGDGWYLPAYEELQNMSNGQDVRPLNGRYGANLLATPNGGYWSSTEAKGNGGRAVVDYDDWHGIRVYSEGGFNRIGRDWASWCRCAWRN
jgi:hypothetical protein